MCNFLRFFLILSFSAGAVDLSPVLLDRGFLLGSSRDLEKVLGVKSKLPRKPEILRLIPETNKVAHYKGDTRNDFWGASFYSMEQAPRRAPGDAGNFQVVVGVVAPIASNADLEGIVTSRSLSGYQMLLNRDDVSALKQKQDTAQSLLQKFERNPQVTSIYVVEVGASGLMSRNRLLKFLLLDEKTQRPQEFSYCVLGEKNKASFCVLANAKLCTLKDISEESAFLKEYFAMLQNEAKGIVSHLREASEARWPYVNSYFRGGEEEHPQFETALAYEDLPALQLQGWLKRTCETLRFDEPFKSEDAKGKIHL